MTLSPGFSCLVLLYCNPEEGGSTLSAIKLNYLIYSKLCSFWQVLEYVLCSKSIATLVVLFGKYRHWF